MASSNNAGTFAGSIIVNLNTWRSSRYKRCESCWGSVGPVLRIRLISRQDIPWVYRALDFLSFYLSSQDETPELKQQDKK